MYSLLIATGLAQHFCLVISLYFFLGIVAILRCKLTSFYCNIRFSATKQIPFTYTSRYIFWFLIKKPAYKLQKYFSLEWIISNKTEKSFFHHPSHPISFKICLKEIQFLASVNTSKGTKSNFKLSARYINFLFCSKWNFIFCMLFKNLIWFPISPGVSKS